MNSTFFFATKLPANISRTANAEAYVFPVPVADTRSARFCPDKIKRLTSAMNSRCIVFGSMTREYDRSNLETILFRAAFCALDS